MATGMELVIGHRWITSVLTSNTGLVTLLGGPKVFSDVIPQKVQGYAIKLSTVVNDDLMVISGNRVWSNADLQVEVIGEGRSYEELEAIAVAFDALLHHQHGDVGGGSVRDCIRQSQIMFIEPVGTDGRQWRHLGFVYRLYIQQS